MNNMNSTTLRISAAAFASAGVLLAASAPAAFADAGQTSPQTAAQTAAVVERTTGTADIAPRVAGTVPTTAAEVLTSSAGDGSTIGISLPASDNATGVASEHGTVVYPDADGSSALAVQRTTEGGVRALAVIANASAPREYRYGLDLPEGAILQQQQDGSVTVLKDGEALGAFQAPWAKDANGAAVPTSYRIQDGALVQTVAFDAGTAFPVVADPTWAGLKKRAKNALKSSDRSTVAGAVGGCIIGAVGAAGAGCGPGAAVGAIGGFAKGAIEGFFK